MFPATHMSRQKTDHTAFTSADAKLCEAFFDLIFNINIIHGSRFFRAVYAEESAYFLQPARIQRR